MKNRDTNVSGAVNLKLRQCKLLILISLLLLEFIEQLISIIMESVDPQVHNILDITKDFIVSLEMMGLGFFFYDMSSENYDH